MSPVYESSLRPYLEITGVVKMYFRNLLKLFFKNKNASVEVHPEVAES